MGNKKSRHAMGGFFISAAQIGYLAGMYRTGDQNRRNKTTGSERLIPRRLLQRVVGYQVKEAHISRKCLPGERGKAAPDTGGRIRANKFVEGSFIY